MPIPSQFRSQAELVNFLETLEQRVETLERENQALKDSLSMPTGGVVIPIQVQRWLDKLVPKTNLLSGSFIVRAFTVWGHYFVAQLIISAGFLLIYLLVMVVLLAAGSR